MSVAVELPDLGDSSANYLSAQDEAALGRQIMMEIRADPAYFNDPETVDFVNHVAGKLLAVSEDAIGMRFEVFVLQDSTLNAFAMPGGYIGVHTGLILAAENESELASVLAHEISHVTQHHVAREMEAQSQNMPLTLAAMAAALLAARTSPDATVGGIVGAQAGAIQAQLNSSRGYEKEADRLGIQRLIRSGYDPRAMWTFFEKLQHYDSFYEAVPAFLKTHPLTTERLAEIQNRLENVPYRQVQDSPNFQLVRSRIKALVGSPTEAIRSFSGEELNPKYPQDQAEIYGYAVALWRNHQFQDAKQKLDSVRLYAKPNAMFLSLNAQITNDQGKLEQALELYRQALNQYPEDRALNYGLINTLLGLHRYQEALDFIRKRLQYNDHDAKLYDLEAQGFSALNQQLLSHQALAYYYERMDNYSAALDQLQIALKTGDGDFYQKSSVEAQIDTLKNTLAADKASRKK
ncbi:MAG: M48 family metallopeptidase [Betaproteobacteria bacterium]|nr:M48 family metalloprotease [Betaproteobacteria bacterium]MDE2423420.1 M48 family metallopeptidase [Betaproteobacteria bacterium]